MCGSRYSLSRTIELITARKIDHVAARNTANESALTADPAFVLGVVAKLLKTDLALPKDLYTSLSIYLLFALDSREAWN